MFMFRHGNRSALGHLHLAHSRHWSVRNPVIRVSPIQSGSQGNTSLTKIARSNARAFNSMRRAQTEVDTVRTSTTAAGNSPSATSPWGSSNHLFPHTFDNFRAEHVPQSKTWEIAAESNSKPIYMYESLQSANTFLYGLLLTRPNSPRRWLRDHCQCSQCIHPDTKQRLFDIFQTQNSQIKECTIRENTAIVTWEEGNHKSEYSLDWLAHAFDVPSIMKNRRGPAKLVSWGPGQADIRNSPPEVKYSDIMTTNEGLADLTRKIREVGFCFIDGCPTDPSATESLLGRLGPIRNTHYGAFWDFTSDLASKDTAYTSLGLDVHTDTTYFTEAAGLQLFHLLSHEGTGGETQLVDGFTAAEKLRDKHPWAYKILSEVELLAHASGNEGLSIQPQVPFRTIAYDEVTNEHVQVRWNNSDRASIMINYSHSPSEIDDWYDAARPSEWNAILQENSADTRYEVQLVPGRPLIFDNWRVLHGRSAFTGKRRMCGGYKVSTNDIL